MQTAAIITMNIQSLSLYCYIVMALTPSSTILNGQLNMLTLDDWMLIKYSYASCQSDCVSIINIILMI